MSEKPYKKNPQADRSNLQLNLDEVLRQQLKKLSPERRQIFLEELRKKLLEEILEKSKDDKPPT